MQLSKAVAAIMFDRMDDTLRYYGGNQIPSVCIKKCEGLKLRALVKEGPTNATLALTKNPAQYSGYTYKSGVMLTRASVFEIKYFLLWIL